MWSKASKSKLLACAAVIVCAFPARAGNVYINPNFPITGGPTEGRSTLSPPVIAAVDACSTHIYVQSYIPKATVRVILNGSIVIGTATPRFGFNAVALTRALHAGDKLTAIQLVNGLSSLPSSPPIIVGAMPATLAAPTVGNDIYACGQIVGVHGLLPGVTVSVADVTAGGAIIGGGFTPNDWGNDWVPAYASSLVGGDQITATQASCSAPASPASGPKTVLADPSPMLPPQLDPPIVGNDALTMHGLYTGASVQAFDATSPIGSGLATGSDNWMPVSTIASTASISAQQALCTTSSSSTPQTPVSAIAPPVLLGPICPDQSIVKVRNTTIDATLVLLNNGVVVGNGGAAPGDALLSIAPPSSFAVGDTVQVVEYIGTLISPNSNVVTVNCAPQNVVTQHNDNARHGAQLAETILNPTNVSGPNFGLLYDRHVLGTLLAQPLYVHGVKIQNHAKNIIVVATAEDIVYAFDADDTSADTTAYVTVRGAMVAESAKWLWRTSLGTPDLSTICPETVPPIVGITSTPVIDVSASTMYVVARDQPDSQQAGYDYLHALDITTGVDLRKKQVGGIGTDQITDPINNFVFNHECERQRPGLLLQQGTVYLGYGTYQCDHNCPNDPFRGWIIGYRATDFAPAGVFTNSKGMMEGGMGVWASGNGLAGTDDGSIFYQTGNDQAPTLAALGDSFVKLLGDGTSLTQMSQYQPPFASEYAMGDTDLGAGGPMLLPNAMLVGGGKDGRFFVLSQSNLTPGQPDFQAFYNSFHYGPGPYPFNSATTTTYTNACPTTGTGTGPTGEVADRDKHCYIDVADYKNGESYGPNIHGGPVFWQYSANDGYIYKMAEKDYLKAFHYDIASGTVNPRPAHVATARPGHDGMPGGFSSMSAHGRYNGIVWTVVQQADSMWGAPSRAIFYAHDAKNLNELWNNGPDAAALAKFTAPTIADGLVVLPSFNLFQVYGLSGPRRPRRSIRDLPLDAAIDQKWVNMGGAQGLLGHPTGDRQRDGSAGLRQDFDTVAAGGGYGRISVPPSVKIEAPMCHPRGEREADVPIQASILASNRTGVHYIIGEIRSRFLQAGGTKRFGYPLTDEVPTPDGLGLMTRFERGTIFWYVGHPAEVGPPKPPRLQVTPTQDQS
jgi:hypothetical protein